MCSSWKPRSSRLLGNFVLGKGEKTGKRWMRETRLERIASEIDSIWLVYSPGWLALSIGQNLSETLGDIKSYNEETNKATRLFVSWLPLVPPSKFIGFRRWCLTKWRRRTSESWRIVLLARWTNIMRWEKRVYVLCTQPSNLFTSDCFVCLVIYANPVSDRHNPTTKALVPWIVLSVIDKWGLGSSPRLRVETCRDIIMLCCMLHENLKELHMKIGERFHSSTPWQLLLVSNGYLVVLKTTFYRSPGKTMCRHCTARREFRRGWMGKVTRQGWQTRADKQWRRFFARKSSSTQCQRPKVF
jgi:hypothetical protein